MTPRDNRTYAVRPIQPDDDEALRKFFNSPINLHQHLDWHNALERLAFRPFWLTEKNNSIIAAFCSPIIQNKISWIQLFAVKKLLSTTRLWQNLFNEFLTYCAQNRSLVTIYSLAYYAWYLRLLESSNFLPLTSIVTLENDGMYSPNRSSLSSNYRIEPITYLNYPLAYDLDCLSFDLPWQMTSAALHKAFRSSIYATLIFDDDKPVGYQITTEGDQSLHLARIAVDPAYQNKGIGTHLINNLFNFMKQARYHNISVNTQSNNQASLALYRKMGFFKTGNQIPVMVYNMED